MLKDPRQINTPTRRKNAAFSARQRLWQSMRILRHFTVRDLMATAEISREGVYALLLPLRRAGIVRQTARCCYQLIRNLGPLAPGVRSDGAIYDHNTRTVIPTGDHHDK